MQAAESSPDLRSIQDLVVAKQFDAALNALNAVLEGDPDNEEALYMSAVCRRYKREFDLALQTI